jgi:hypothetical protein
MIVPLERGTPSPSRVRRSGVLRAMTVSMSAEDQSLAGGMRVQGAVSTMISLDHHNSRGDQARALGRGSQGRGPAGGTGPARRQTSSDTQRDPRRIDPKASGFQAFTWTAERLAATLAAARLAKPGPRH